MNRRSKQDGRHATKANLFGNTLCARMLRFVMDEGRVLQVGLMAELHRIGGKATGYAFAFKRFERHGVGLLKRVKVRPAGVTRNWVTWTGPTHAEWLASMTHKELDEASGRMEHEYLEAIEDHDAQRALSWRKLLDKEGAARVGRVS